MIMSVEEEKFAALTRKISRERGFECASYKEKCLRRRIAVRMRARAVHSFDDYGRILDQDDREYDLLLDALTINVTKLFRNPGTFDAIARFVVPALCAQNTRKVKVWSAGSASGEEAYSLAILFHQHNTSDGDLAAANRVSVLGTDIDAKSLARAEKGAYPEAAFADMPHALRQRYFSARAPYKAVDEVRTMIRFSRHDLLREPPPEQGFSLIACRNVIIYFDRDSQEKLFDKFHNALEPGGYLVLGKVETLFGPARERFATVDAAERIFKRR
ncbi:MAG: protein-glutamate O-methyltransferase CheR [Gemmatimonadaceae bacterium]